MNQSFHMICIIVERFQEEPGMILPDDFETFDEAVPVALREYADACDKDSPEVYGDVVKFEASNGCIVKVIAGARAIK